MAQYKNNDGTITNDHHEKSEIFNTYYSSVWTDDNGILPDFPRHVPNDTNIADIVFTSSNVLKQLMNLKVNSSALPDGIKPIFYKNLAHCRADPLASMFNTCLEANFVPNGWLRAHVKPMFRKGVCSDCNNYRPIALTCVRLWSASLQPTCFSIYVIII